MPDVPLNALIAMAAVFWFLVLATCTRLILAAKNTGKDYTELRKRIQSWW